MVEQMYKVLNGDGTAFHGGNGRWPLPGDVQPGDWLEVQGKLVPCQNGLHLCTMEQLIDWIGPVLFEAEYKGEIIEADNKFVARKARLLRRVDAWNDRTLRLWGCDCAERALAHDPSPNPRSVESIRVSRAFARGEATAEQLAAARDAAWAAGDASWAAAWAAARATAWTAAGDAAWAAAGDTAWAAARDAAWAAAWAAVWAAAGDAAGDAAREAARDTAWAAAREDERAWQVTRLRQYLEIKG